MRQSEIFEKVAGKLYDMLTDADPKTWRKPWELMADANMVPPMNYKGDNYNGVNRMVLAISANAQGFRPELPWGTFKAWKSMNCRVNKGEHNTPIIFWNWVEKENDDGELEKRCFVRYFKVFHAEQVSGFDADIWLADHRPDFVKAEPAERKQSWKELENAERAIGNFAKATSLTIAEKEQNRAFYSPDVHKIVMPSRSQFNGQGAAGFYSTLLHECIHSTGHKDHLDRKLSMESESYAKEELVAESGAAMLCGLLGVYPEGHAEEEQHAAYIKGWLKGVTRSDGATALAHAMQRAHKAANYFAEKARM